MAKDKSKDDSSALDDKRAEMLQWATDPLTKQGRHSFAHLNSGHPYAMATMRYLTALREQYANATYYEPRKEKMGTTYYADVDFNPKYHYKVDQDKIKQLTEEFVDNLLASTTAVLGKRAQLILETVRDIGRPQMDMGGFGDSGMDDLEPPEEVEKRE